MTNSVTVPVPLEPLKEDFEDKRLWIGNLDPRVTEFTLVKLLQTYGQLEKFDLLFHRTGPLEGQPRGYAFVTYSSATGAKTAKQHLDEMLVGAKKICVKWAHSVPKNDLDKQKIIPEILTLGENKTQTKLSRESVIKAIEAKLELMEKASELSEFKVLDTPALPQSSPVLVGDQSKSNKSKYVSKYKMKPYTRGKGKS